MSTWTWLRTEQTGALGVCGHYGLLGDFFLCNDQVGSRAVGCGFGFARRFPRLGFWCINGKAYQQTWVKGRGSSDIFSHQTLGVDHTHMCSISCNRSPAVCSGQRRFSFTFMASRGRGSLWTFCGSWIRPFRLTKAVQLEQIRLRQKYSWCLT